MRRRWLGRLTALLVLCGSAVSGANTLSELRGLKTRDSRMPVYSRDRLQLLLYSVECEQKGRLLETLEPVLDIIRADADIDTIDTGRKTRNIYPLGAPLAEVFKFWIGHRFSDGVVVTDKADIDQESQQAAGSGEVFFRSPLLDLNGIGFDADYRKRTIFVRKNVRILLRTENSDPMKLIQKGKLPEKYEFLRGSADTLLIDMTNRVITLSGRVRVTEERGVIDCDRMMIILPPEHARRDQKDQDDEPELGIKGVSRVVCEGHVRVVRVGAKEMQQATADRMDYDLEKGRLRLTGTLTAPPVLRQGNNSLRGRVIDIYRETESMLVDRDCRLVYLRAEKGQKPQPIRATADRMVFDNRKNSGTLSGKVRVEESRFTLDCAKMDILLAENGPADARQKAAVSELTGMPEFAPGGKKELRNMHCSGGVRLVRRQTAGGVPEHAEAAEADLVYPEEIVTLSGGRPTITRGSDTLSGDRIRIAPKEERLVVEPKCRIVFTGGQPDAVPSRPAAGAAGKLARTVVTADRGDLGYGSNLLKFTGKVQVRDPRMALDCDVMDIILKDAPGAKKSPKLRNDDIVPESLAGPDAQKQLDRIVCTGNVKAREPRMKLDSDRLTLVFRPAADDKSGKPGMFQSHGTELCRILTDGHVMMENVPETPKPAATAPEKSSGAELDKLFPGMSSGKPVRLTADHGKVDLPGNLSEFHGTVKIRQEQGSLDCEDLYLYAKDAAPQSAAAAPAARLAGLDDDPFASSEPTQVPQVISIGDEKTLDRVVALKNVVLVRRTPAGEQRATGQKAEYFVNRRIVELTGAPPEYAQVIDANPQNNGRGRKITVFLDRESVSFDGRVQMEFDRKNSPGDGGLPL